MKPAKASVVKSIAAVTANNLQSKKLAPKNVFKIEQPAIDIADVKEEQPSTDDHCQIDHFGDDFDISGLENDEIKLEENVSVTVPEPLTKQSTVVQSKSVVKSADIFENIRPNWDNAYRMEDDDDDDLLSAVADEAMSVTDEKQVDMKFWYWDAWEDPAIPGQIFLFGKIACDNNSRTTEYKSICVKVENVEYCVYVLPREFVRAFSFSIFVSFNRRRKTNFFFTQVMDTDTNCLTKTPVTMKAVYEEFTESIAKKHGISEYRSKAVTKNFAFSVPDVNVPMTCDYLEVCLLLL